MINEIAEKIRNLRKEKNLTLKDLSEKTGLSISFLSQVENNSSSLAITSLKKNCRCAKCTYNLLFQKSRASQIFSKKTRKRSF